MHRIKPPRNYLRLFIHIQNLVKAYSASNYTIALGAFDPLTNEVLQKSRMRENPFLNDFNLRYFMATDSYKCVDISNMNAEEIENLLQDLMTKNKEKQITKIIIECLDKRKIINGSTVKKLFRYYSISGKIDIVELLQKYCLKVDPNLYKRNGEFLHYVAKAQCMKGNSDKGLAILTQAYVKYEGLRSFYRVILRELIHDSVFNRSEASLVIFKKYVLEFSEKWKDHYPLICFWHICWSSNWFSDQMLSDDLLESSEQLREIVKDKATTLTINILREYNEDAVLKLLQTLLKYGMIAEYTRVLQILFSYKLKTRDLRGCTEIIRNCETLGISLPSSQQGKYIKMLINNKQDDKDDKPTKPESKNFKLKF